MSLEKDYRYLLGIDFETASSARASACSIGLYLKEWHTARVLAQKEILIDPECEFSPFSMQIHGIHPCDVEGCDTFPTIARTIGELLTEDTLVIAHNASFDMSVLRQSCERYQLSMPSFDYLCTYLISKNVIPDLPKHKLTVVSDFFDMPKFGHHKALDDARACVLLFERLMSEIHCETVEEATCCCGVVCGTLHENMEYDPCHKAFASETILTVCQSDLDRLSASAKTHHREKRARKSSLTNPRLASDMSYPLDEPIAPYQKPTKPSIVKSVLIDSCPKKNAVHPLYEKVVVFTGTLTGFTREMAHTQLQEIGGIPATKLSKKTNLLVCGRQNAAVLKSSKVIKAEQYLNQGADIKVICDNEYLRLYEECLAKYQAWTKE